jgi:hypothetical protein
VASEQEVAHGKTINLAACKTLHWAGATPLFRLSAAQKVRGVAPALTGTLGPRFARLHTQT